MGRAIAIDPQWPAPYLQRGLFERFHGDLRAALDFASRLLASHNRERARLGIGRAVNPDRRDRHRGLAAGGTDLGDDIFGPRPDRHRSGLDLEGRRLARLGANRPIAGLHGRRLGAADLANHARVIVEKPFGRDLASAHELNRLVASVLDELGLTVLGAGSLQDRFPRSSIRRR